MKNIIILLLILSFVSCKKTQTSNDKIYDYKLDSSKEINLDSYLNDPSYKFENWIESITKEEFIKDSIDYKSNYVLEKSLFNNNVLTTSYGKVKFTPNKNTSSDAYVDYSYLGYIKKINSHIININLYEGSKALIISNANYQSELIEAEPIFSPNAEKLLSFANPEGLSTNLTLYKLNAGKPQRYLTLWSDEFLTNYAIWNSQNEIILKIQKNDGGYEYFKISNKRLDSNINKHEKKETDISEQASNINWKGSYDITSKAISQYNNQEIDLLYTITINSDKSATLSIGADQVQDYWCEGEYKLTKENNILHAKGKCDENDLDDFYLKNENEKYYIRSKRFINQDWQELTKK
ncbi:MULTISPECIES: hypothetical protein [Chryseobacterium]|uniref:hypothetical protein n=1 Tax=Chryseobacterium TaxID=59732 RepID=UPI000C9E2B98|nr:MULTISPECIES: hypothetical protein [Chryseobacterium]VXC17839.1 conserved hypothetical protein [Chryseobacterium sp. 8AT]